MRRLYPSHHPQTYQSLANLTGRRLPIPRAIAFELWGNHRPRGLICEAPEGCSLHRHRSSAKRMTDVQHPFPTPSTPCGSPSRDPPSRRPTRGRGLFGMAYTSVFGTACLDRCLWNGHPCGCRYSFTGNSFDGLFLRDRQSGAKKKERSSHQTASLLFLCIYPQRIRRSTWLQWWDGRGRPPGGGYCTPSAARYRWRD